jgi:hypothetical protein
MLIVPLYSPIAKYWPSFVHEQAVDLAGSLVLFTAFCSGFHNAIRNSHDQYSTSHEQIIRIGTEQIMDLESVDV